MTSINKILEANQKYAETSTQRGPPGRPTRLRLAVVACMDCRLHASKLLGLELGDAHIIRNAGGIVTEDVLRSLIVSCNIDTGKLSEVSAPPDINSENTVQS